MATQPQVRFSGDVFNLGTSGSIAPELKKEGVDQATKLTYITRDISKFSNMVHMKNPKAKVIKEGRKIVTREIMELERYYTVSVSSTTGANAFHKRIGLPNNEAAQIQVNDILYIKNLYPVVVYNRMVAGQVYPASGGTQGTNIGPDLGWDVGGNPISIQFSRTKGLNGGYYFLNCEQVKVVEVEAKDSAGAGHTYITIDRCVMSPHAKDEGGRTIPRALVYSANGISGSTDAQLSVGEVLLRGTPAFYEGTNAPEGLYKNPVSDNNFIQLWKYAVSHTLESELEATWISDSPMDISRWLTTRRANRDREMSYLFGSKAMEMDSEGKAWYTSGGVVEFIRRDADHYIRYPQGSLSWPGWLDIGKQIFQLYGSEHRVCWCGYTVDAELRKMFYADQHMRFDPDMSNAFDIEVSSIIVSGGKLSIIPTQVFEEAGYDKMMICLDMSNADAFVPCTTPGWDFKHDPDISEPGLNMKKELIQGMFGLERRYQQYHCIVDLSGAI